MGGDHRRPPAQPQTQPLDQTPETPEPYIRNAVSIAFAGDLHSGGMPTPDQLAAGGALIAWLLKRFPRARRLSSPQER